MKYTFYALLFIFVLITCLAAETTIEEGLVFGTWTADNDPYLIKGDITIPDDSTLIINPGVLVEFQKHAGLWVQGRLLAQGTEADSIIFTVADTSGFNEPDTSGGWYGIRFIDTPTNNDSSKIAYCRLEYGKAIGNVWYLNAGGAMCILNFAKIAISHCLFINNLAGGLEQEIPSGGAIHLGWSDILIEETTFTRNRATEGGAIQCHESNPTLINTVFTSNQAHDIGGISFSGNCNTIISNCHFINNIGQTSGGAIGLGYHSSADIHQTTFTGNSALSGGGIFATYSELRIDDCTFEDNQVSNLGAGLSLDSCRVELTNSSFRNNHASVWGGGIHTFNCLLEMTDCTFAGNEATDLGGGIHADYTWMLFRNVTFLENSAAMSGAIHSWYTDLQVKNCRFERNTAVGSGAGIHGDYSHLKIDSTRFYNNQADWGSAVQVYNCDLQIDSCFFMANSAINGRGGAVDYSADSTIFGRHYLFNLTRNQFLTNHSSASTAGIFIDQSNSDVSLVDVTVDHCLFAENHSDVYCPFRIAGYISDFLLANCTFKNNTSSRWVAGAGFISGVSGRVENCVFQSNYASYSNGSGLSSGSSVGMGAEVEFFNCTFVDTANTTGYGISVRSGSKGRIVNSIIWGCGQRPVNVLSNNNDIGCDVSIFYCAIENGADSVYTVDTVSTIIWGEGNIGIEPQFVNLGEGDLHLQDASPLIGAGVNCLLLDQEWKCAPTSDIEGKTRPSPLGSNVDIGAYENVLGTPTAIADQRILVPGFNQLHQNYPNPFNPTTAIVYQLSAASHVRLLIYNLLGQKIATLVDKWQPTGFYQVPWAASEMASGVYIYRIQTDKGFHDSKRMLLLR